MLYPVGCHVVAPSDMMDNRVAAIKRRLADAGLAGKVSKPHQVAIKPSGKSQSRSLGTMQWFNIIMIHRITRAFSRTVLHHMHAIALQ